MLLILKDLKRIYGEVKCNGKLTDYYFDLAKMKKTISILN